MKIWVDADSCPVAIRDIISRAGIRESISVEFVANREIPLKKNPYIIMTKVAEGDQVADEYIVDNVETDDMVISRDIPLANDLVEKGILVLNDRGSVYTMDNIKQRLSMRNFMKEIRESGIYSEQNPPFGKKDIQLFANAFDSQLRRRIIEINRRINK